MPARGLQRLIRKTRRTRYSYVTRGPRFMRPAVRRALGGFYKPHHLRHQFPNHTAVISKALTIPDAFYTKLKMNDQHLINTTVTSDGVGEVWNLNNLIDMSVSDAGQTQTPNGFSNFAALYDRYQVYGVKIDMLIINNGTDAIAFNQKTHHASSVSNDWKAFTEVSPHRSVLISNNASGGKYAFSHYYDLARESGFPKSEFMGHSSYEAFTTGGPSNAIYWSYLLYNIKAAGATVDCSIDLSMTVYVKFREKEKSRPSDT